MKNRTSGRHESLFCIIFSVFVPSSNIVIELCVFFFTPLQFNSESFCKDLLCKIITGRSETAGGDNNVHALFCDLHTLSQALRIVPHDRVVQYINSDRRKRL